MSVRLFKLLANETTEIRRVDKVLKTKYLKIDFKTGSLTSFSQVRLFELLKKNLLPSKIKS